MCPATPNPNAHAGWVIPLWLTDGPVTLPLTLAGSPGAHISVAFGKQRPRGFGQNENCSRVRLII